MNQEDNNLESMFTGIFGLSMHSQSLAKAKELEAKGYSFKVATKDDINYQKIMDDLSYADPLRIVKFEDKLYAVIHHTIFDKARRCLLPKNNHIICKLQMSSVTPIESSDIKKIVRDIQLIKQAQWDKSPPKNIQVEVIKVNV